MRSRWAGHNASRHAAPSASVFGCTGASELPNNAAAADAALVGIRFSMAAFDAATAALDPTSAVEAVACATARDAADAVAVARSDALLLANAADSTTLECAWLTTSDSLEDQPCGPAILGGSADANSKSGSARGFDTRGSVRKNLFATGFSLHQVPRNIRTRSSIQVGRALVNGLHPTAPPQPGQQPKGGVRSYSPMVLYIYKSALNNIGDCWGEFGGQYTSGGRLSGMPPGDARWRCTESA